MVARVNKAFIFDMDGLLIDSEPIFVSAWKMAAEELGIKTNKNFLGKTSGSTGKALENIINDYFPHVDARKLIDRVFEIVTEVLKENVPLKEGSLELLDFLYKNNHKLALASGSPLELVESNLIKAGLDKYFEVIVSGDQVKYGKPSPDIFIKACNKLNIKPKECIVIEDSNHGVEAAVRAGCQTFMVPDLVRPTLETMKIVDFVFVDLNEILEFLKKCHKQ